MATRSGKPNDGIPGRTPAWAILFHDGQWIDSRDYLPATLTGEPGPAIVLYRDADNQTRTVWGYSWVGYFPGFEAWIGMDDRDLAIRRDTLEQTIQGLMPGLLMDDRTWEQRWVAALTHRDFQEIAADFDPLDFTILPTRRLILKRQPQLTDRIEEVEEDARERQRQYDARAEALRQLDLARASGGG